MLRARGRALAVATVVLAVVACGGEGSPAPSAPPATSPPAAPAALEAPAPSPGSGSAPVTSPPAAIPTGNPAVLAVRFDAGRAHRDVAVLADPTFQGRHVGTPGEIKGASYLSQQFQAVGLQPGGDNGSYLQEFPITVTELRGVPELRIRGPGSQDRGLRLRDDFRPLITGPLGPGAAEGEGYFAGYGEDLKPDELQGRVVILVAARRAVRDVVPELRQAGAAGLIVTTGAQPLRKGEAGNPDPDALPAAQVSREGFNALMQAAGRDPEELRQAVRDNRNLAAFPLGVTLRLSSAVERKEIRARNVVGILPGQGDEVVVLGAHYEEIGPDPDGVVYPAANDNASGTAVMLEIARLLKEGGVRPKASAVFIGWSGHEEGLLGSAYYVEHPALPLDRTRAYLNLDTVGQGSGANLTAATEGANLEGLLKEVQGELEGVTGQRVPIEVTGQREGGSDHVQFRRRGIAAVAFSWAGLFQSPIHTPEDTAQVVDPEKLRTTGQVAALLLLKLIMG